MAEVSGMSCSCLQPPSTVAQGSCSLHLHTDSSCLDRITAVPCTAACMMCGIHRWRTVTTCSR